MSDVLWPGDSRAGALFGDRAVLDAAVDVEAAWLAALMRAGIAPDRQVEAALGPVTDEDLAAVAMGSEAGGNPVIPLVARLRERVEASSPGVGRWLHRGLTSQDVLDTALMLCTRDALAALRTDLDRQVEALSDLADRHRSAPMVARTLTQYAVPTTFGLKAATWLDGVLDAAEALDTVASALPVQLGGAAGTLAATTELVAGTGRTDSAMVALELVGQVAAALRLTDRGPWHTARATVTQIGDALVGATDAWGRIANDVLTLGRPEIAELAEPVVRGQGSSSTMPHKANPVLSVLIRRAALAGPLTAAQLHLAAADSRDERSDGAWHLEWSTLALLARRTAVAGSQAAELLAGLTVDTERMRSRLESVAEDVLAERRGLLGGEVTEVAAVPSAPESYLGAAEELADATIARARRWRESAP